MKWCPAPFIKATQQTGDVVGDGNMQKGGNGVCGDNGCASDDDGDDDVPNSLRGAYKRWLTPRALRKGERVEVGRAGKHEVPDQFAGG